MDTIIISAVKYYCQ